MCVAKLGGLGVSQIAVLAPGFSSDGYPAQFGAIPATKSIEEWGGDKGMLIASWSRFKGQEADAIVTIETSVRGDSREGMNRYVAPAKYLLRMIEVKETCVQGSEMNSRMTMRTMRLRANYSQTIQR